MKKVIILLLAIITSTQPSFSQVAADKKSIEDNDNTKFNLEGILLPVPLITSAIALYDMPGIRFQQVRESYKPNFHSNFDDYLKFAPNLMLYILKISGVESQNSYKDIIISNGISALMLTGGVHAIKIKFKSERPDKSGTKSFPSGHTAVAFMGATMVHHEFGLKHSTWYSAAAYSLAATTAVMRILNNKHYLQDVIMGAGIGILSAEIGYVITNILTGNANNLIDNGLKIFSKEISNIGPSHIGFSTEYSKTLNNITFNNIKQKKGTYGTGAYLESIAYFPSIKSLNWGINGLVGANSTGHINELIISLGPAISYSLRNIVRVGVTLEGGYSHIQAIDQDLRKSSSGLYMGSQIYIERELINKVIFRLYGRSRNAYHPSNINMHSLSLGGSLALTL